MKGWIGDQEITVLRDTGSNGVMIRAELVDSSQYTGRNQRMMSITSRLEEFPVAWIQIDCQSLLDMCKPCVCLIRFVT